MAYESYLFAGTSNSYIQIDYNSLLSFGASDFTIEWWQNQTDTNPFPRVFQIGTYAGSTVQIGVSIEGGTFYIWNQGNGAGRTPNAIGSLSSSQYKNKWVHFAICRTASITTVYMNGQPFGTPFADTNVYDFTGHNLYLSKDVGESPSNNASFGGFLDGFHWVNGFCKYVAPFPLPTSLPPIIDGQTVFMLSATGNYKVPGSDIIWTFQNIELSTNNPFTPPPPVPVTNNEYVYNKYALLTPVDPIQKKKQQALETVTKNYKDNKIYNKSAYAGTNDRYNAFHSVSQVRNGGAVVPPKCQNRG